MFAMYRSGFSGSCFGSTQGSAGTGSVRSRAAAGAARAAAMVSVARESGRQEGMIGGAAKAR